MKRSDDPIVVEQVFDTDMENVWLALTDPDRMRQWFFDNMPDFKAEVGFRTEFNVSSGERVFPHIWEVTEVNPGQKISVNWTYEGYQGESLVTFELDRNDNKTKLTLTTEIIQDFPDDIPEFRRESCIGGWDYFIKGNLKTYLS